MNELNLDCYDSRIEEELKQTLQYPCLVIRNLQLECEIEFLKMRVGDTSKSLQAYAVVDGEYIDVGAIELTLESIMTLRSINDYQVILYRSLDDYSNIDLNDPKTYINLLSI